MTNSDMILDQFIEGGNRFTYMTKFFDKYNDGAMPDTIARFKIKMKVKDRRNFIQRLFKPNTLRNYCYNHFISNQIHKW